MSLYYRLNLNIIYTFFSERELQRSLENIRMEYSAAKLEIDLLQSTQDDSPRRSMSDLPQRVENENGKQSSPVEELVMADDDEISDEEELFNKMLIIEKSANQSNRQVIGMENSPPSPPVPVISGDGILEDDQYLNQLTIAVENSSRSSAEVEVEVDEDYDQLDSSELKHQVRIRPVGKSRDPTPTQCKSNPQCVI